MLRIALLAICVVGCTTGRPPDAPRPGERDATPHLPDAGHDAGPISSPCTDAERFCDGMCCAGTEVCTTAGCCAPERACDGSCCPATHVCEAGSCMLDCPNSGRCGDPTVCCGEDQVCYLDACVTPGDACGSAPELACGDVADCPDGEYCEPTLGRCLPRGPSGECEYTPPIGTFDPVVEWAWTGDPILPAYDQVIMAPAVADIDGDCAPDILFHSYTGLGLCGDGVLRAIRGDGSGAIFTVSDPALRSIPVSGITVGNIDDDPEPEILTCGNGGGVCYRNTRTGPLMALEHDGTLKWVSTDPRIVCSSFSAPALVDLDSDGRSEILVRYTAVNRDGNVIWHGRTNTHPWFQPEDFVTAADLDGDGRMEVVGGKYAWRWDGTPYYEASIPLDGYPAVANLDADPEPEVVSVSPRHPSMWALNHDGSVLWGPVDLSAGRSCRHASSGGGPPTIADFDGDGDADVGVVGGCGYVAVRGHDGGRLWVSDTRDTSVPSTGSSVFDFDGDGRAEVVYADETRLRIFDGRDGAVLTEMCNTSWTGFEMPVIADVDADDSAELVLVSNDTCPGCAACAGGVATHGLRVIGDRANNWVRTRRVWNQHTYHVTNVDGNHEVPRRETPNWTVPALNNFRQNIQVEGLLNAPNLVADLTADHVRCSSAIVLRARVLNRGAAGAPPGVLVRFERTVPMTMPMSIGTASTTRALLPGESEVVELVWTAPPAVLQQPAEVRVRVDDPPAAGPNGAVNECIEDDNIAGPVAIGCNPII